MSGQNKIPQTSKSEHSRKSQPHSFLLEPATETVIDTIKSLKNKKSYDYDENAAAFLKEIPTPICHFINNIICRGICPSCYKLLIVIALHKNGSKTR